MGRREYFLLHHLRASGFDLRERNRILPSAKESLKHLVAKAMIGWMLNERGICFLTEAAVEVNGSVAYIDVFDCENGIAYEVQNAWHGSVKKVKEGLFDSPIVKDVIVVRLKELADDIKIMHRQLKKIVV